MSTNPYESSSAARQVGASGGTPVVSDWSNAPVAQGQGWAPAPTGQQHVVPSAALASPWLRLAATLINLVLIVVTLGIGFLVWALVLWNQGTNPGKKMCGMRVVQAETGQTCTFGEMLVRSFVFRGIAMGFISTFTLGIGALVDLLMIFGGRHQRLIDRMAKTLVVVG